MDSTNQNNIVGDTSAQSVSQQNPTTDIDGVSYFNTSFNKTANPAPSPITDVKTNTAVNPSQPDLEPAVPVVPKPSGLVDAMDFNMNKPPSLQQAAPSTPAAPVVSNNLISTEEASILPKQPGIPAKETSAPNLDFSYPDDVPVPAAAPVDQTPKAPELAPISKTETPKPTTTPMAVPTQVPQKDMTQLTKSVNEINKKPEPTPLKSEPQSPPPTPAPMGPTKEAQPLNIPPKSKPVGGAYPYKIEELLDMVVQRNASDLHISQGYPAMIRIDEVLTPVSTDIIDQKAAEDLIYPLMEQDKRDILEVNREVDFGYSFAEQARFRINAYYERKRLAAALRMIPTKIKTLEELQLPKIFSEITKLPQGLVLVTGPTGSGKSTTLAAMIDQINKERPLHIVTIEDPIEYIYKPEKALIDQREMHEDTNSWEIALRSVLRQDPDVVLVGEMRDFETIAAALTVAETGHLVFATLHTNSAAQSVDRIIDVFPEFQQSQVRLQLSNVVEAVIAQRLVPIIGGGRRAVTEVMLATPAVRNLIREGKSEQIDNTIRTGVDVGMMSLEQSLVKLVREGKLSLEDAQMYTTKPDEVLRLVKG